MQILYLTAYIAVCGGYLTNDWNIHLPTCEHILLCRMSIQDDMHDIIKPQSSSGHVLE